MITLHDLEQSRSGRIVWLLEELGLEYRLERYARDPATGRSPQALRAVHPLGKAPVLEDGGIQLCESGAIVDFLLVRYGAGRLAPGHDDADWPRYVQWLHFAEGSAAFALISELLLGMTGGGGAALAAAARAEISKTLDFMEAGLEQDGGFGGPAFSAADVMMAFPVLLAALRGHLGPRRRLAAFLARMQARPAWQRAARHG